MQPHPETVLMSIVHLTIPSPIPTSKHVLFSSAYVRSCSSSHKFGPPRSYLDILVFFIKSRISYTAFRLSVVLDQFPVKLSCRDRTRECRSTSSITPLMPNFSASRFISFPSSGFALAYILFLLPFLLPTPFSIPTPFILHSSPLHGSIAIVLSFPPFPHSLLTSSLSSSGKGDKYSLLNFNLTKLPSLLALGSSFVSIFIELLAFGGRKERNNRAVLAFGEKGLKTVVTSVRKRVIIFARFAVDSGAYVSQSNGRY